MTKDSIRKLAAHRGYPSVSILLPTHRAHPENKQDPILLKNLAREAEERLLHEHGKRGASDVLAALKKAIEEIDHEHNLDGLAIFVSHDVCEVVKLPCSVKARVQIDETFAIRDLAYAAERSPRYHALVLSEKPTRLFDCWRDLAVEIVRDDLFPVEHVGPGGEGRLPGGAGIDPSAVRDTQRREFVRLVDGRLRQATKGDERPLVVTGTQEFLADFRALSHASPRLLATVSGSYDYASAAELGRIVWPAAEAEFHARRQARIGELEEAVGAQKAASGLPQVLKAAKESRVAVLFVEEDFHVSAVVDESGVIERYVDDPAHPESQDDAVDLAIQETLARGGDVVFLDPGSLAKHESIGAILRY